MLNPLLSFVCFKSNAYHLMRCTLRRLSPCSVVCKEPCFHWSQTPPRCWAGVCKSRKQSRPSGKPDLWLFGPSQSEISFDSTCNILHHITWKKMDILRKLIFNLMHYVLQTQNIAFYPRFVKMFHIVCKRATASILNNSLRPETGLLLVDG